MANHHQHPTHFYLPDVLAEWPWRRRLSPFYKEVKAESSTWVESYHPFQNPKDLHSFRLCDFALLSSLTWTPRDRDIIRLGSDLMMFFFVFDEYTDLMAKDAALHLANQILDAFRNPSKPRPDSDSCVAKMAQDFISRAIELVGPDAPCIPRFVTESEEYLMAVVEESDDRTHKRVRTVEDFALFRRKTSGASPTLAFTPFGLDLPDEVMDHPAVQSLTTSAIDLICIINDLNSYWVEHAKGADSHNIITVAMNEFGFTLQETLDWLSVRTKKIVDTHMLTLDSLPSWGSEVDERLESYLDTLGQWVRGSDDWSFEGHRYFGKDSMQIKADRLVRYQAPRIGCVGGRASSAM